MDDEFQGNGDLDNSELVGYLNPNDYGEHTDARRMASELQRHRRMVARLEEWASQLENDTYSNGGSGVGPFLALELRNRMAGKHS